MVVDNFSDPNMLHMMHDVIFFLQIKYHGEMFACLLVKFEEVRMDRTTPNTCGTLSQSVYLSISEVRKGSEGSNNTDHL